MNTEVNYRINKLCRNSISKKIEAIRWQKSGKITNVVGTLIEASLDGSQIGTICEIELKKNTSYVKAEVVGFRGNKALLLPYENLKGVFLGSKIKILKISDTIPVGESLLGHVFDSFLQPLSTTDHSIFNNCKPFNLENEPPNPMSRNRIVSPMNLGVKAIDGLLTFCEGQRMGIMAGSGVGKSVLIGMIARGSSADINIIGLIGERGREVKEFLDKELGPEGLKKSIVVASTSDQSPLMRLRAAKAVTSLAEYFSSKNKRVLLIMDSLTRVAQAQREVGLAVGEPPTAKGYPPSVFSLLPKLLERCGPQENGKGSISGLYTVLVDGDDFNDPIPDTTRSLLDGHINLSRQLAEKAHYPAIDITTSISRLMNDVIPENHLKIATEIKTLLSLYKDNEDYINLGSYKPGTNQKIDAAIILKDKIDQFLKQSYNSLSSFEETIIGMNKIFIDETQNEK